MTSKYLRNASLALALVLLPWESVATPKVLRYDFAKVKKELPTKKLDRRDDGVSVDLVNFERVLYLVNISIGTPPQTISLQLDTGSSDLWVPSVDLNQCREGNCGDGSFNPNLSSSFQLVEDASPFEIFYIDNSSYVGKLFVDTLQIGETIFENVTMGIAEEAQQVNTDCGIWGISFPMAQANVNEGDPPYQSVLEKMKRDGAIKSISYSLWLDSTDAESGTILFGGVDSAKFKPPLIGVPIMESPSDEASGEMIYSEMVVEFTSLYINGPSGNFTLTGNDTVAFAFLDSGTTVSELPKVLADKIYSYFGVRREFGVPYLPCNLSTADVNLAFGFGGANGPRISVPIGALVDTSVDKWSAYRFADGTEACELLLEYSEDDSLLLGDSFLRSAYVVYDLENHQIALAQSNLSPGAPEITEIDGNTIPGVASVVSAIPQPTSNTTLSPSLVTEPATPWNFSGRFTDSAPKASLTARGSTWKGAAAGRAAAMIGSTEHLECGAMSIISALLAGSSMVFL